MEDQEKVSTAKPVLRYIKENIVIKVFITAILLYVAACIIQPHYLSFSYAQSLIVFGCFLGVLSIGQTLTILTGGIDLSIIITFTLAACMCTAMHEMNQLLATSLIIGMGLTVGLVNGLGVAFLEIPAMVMTLATQSIMTTVVYLYTGGLAQGAAPSWLKTLSVGNIGSIRIAIIFWTLLAASITFLLVRTNYGRRLYALGNNTSVSYYSGVNNRGVLVTTYILSGGFAALAGMLYVGYLTFANIGVGSSFLLPTIAAVVIGGTSIMGGKGTYLGTVAGAIILYVLNAMLSALNISNAGEKIIYGFVIILVLLLYGRAKKQD
jgi:ribose transport system permease protein